MEFRGTIINHENKSFGLAYVQYSDFRNSKSLQEVKTMCSEYFSDLPILIACEDTIDNSIFYGDEKLIDILSEIKRDSIDWRTYTI